MPDPICCICGEPIRSHQLRLGTGGKCDYAHPVCTHDCTRCYYRHEGDQFTWIDLNPEIVYRITLAMAHRGCLAAGDQGDG